MAVYRRYKTGLIVDALLGSDDEAIQPTGSSSSDRPQPVVRPSAPDGPQKPVSTCAARPQPIVRSPALAAQTPVSACVARPRQAARPPTPVAQTRGRQLRPASPPRFPSSEGRSSTAPPAPKAKTASSVPDDREAVSLPAKMPKQTPLSPAEIRSLITAKQRSDFVETGGAGTRQRSFNDDWRAIETFTFKDVPWWETAEGIIDSRIAFPCKRSSQGHKLQTAVACCKSVLRHHTCQYKIGIARSLGIRWKMYMESKAEWRPTHLWLLLEVEGKEAVGYAEAALIAILKKEFPLEQCVNWHHRDLGGTGHHGKDEYGSDYFVYLACKANTLLSNSEGS